VDEYNKPCIIIVIKNPELEVLRQILAGIEEEGMLAEVINSKGLDYLNETHNVSRISRLGIGIGVFGSRVILHYNKLRENNPIKDAIIYGSDLKGARSIGNNAARLYKVMPLKDE